MFVAFNFVVHITLVCMFLPGLLPLFRPCMPGPGGPPLDIIIMFAISLERWYHNSSIYIQNLSPSPLQSCILMFVLLCIVNEKYIGRFKTQFKYNAYTCFAFSIPVVLSVTVIDVLCKFSSSFSCLLSAETSSSFLQLRLLSAAGVIIFCSFLQLSLLTCDVWS